MKIILLSDVASLGKKDDVVEVSAGYARNSLIPKHLGEEATPANLNNLKLRKKHEAKIEKENLEKALELKKKRRWKSQLRPVKADVYSDLFPQRRSPRLPRNSTG